MKLVRKISKKKANLFILILSLLNFSCNKEGVLFIKKELSGEEMFKEIILFSGEDLEKKIPQYTDILKQIDNLNESQKKEFEKFKNEIIQNIKIIDENFFQKFKRVIESKDLHSIQDILSESGDMVMASLAISEKYNLAYKEADRVLQKMKDLKLNNYDDTSNFEKKLKMEYEQNISELKKIYESNKNGVNDLQSAIGIVLVLAVGVVLLLAGVVTHAVAAVIAAVWGGVVTKTATLDVSKEGDENLLKKDLIVRSIFENY
ncbi:hypothetical protein ACILE2_08185 [Capnocytophaga canimorsus]|uniref:hypothetical protein n=1 Tax=Capnocytophaga canimorsus TaxID=28188 RepID=UPI0037CE32FC